LSALVLPGAGHLYLKHVRRGAALMVLSVACLGIIAGMAWQRASALLGQLESDAGVLDAGQLTERLIQMSDSPSSTAVTAATLVLAACWLAGIVDVYRLGKSKGATR
jgi:hypothetical protein